MSIKMINKGNFKRKDIEKAFDTVWHKDLIYKLAIIELCLYIVKLLLSYLCQIPWCNIRR